MPRTLLVRDYLLVALRLDRLAPGTVDAYTGDTGLIRHCAAGPAPDPADLVRTATRLRAGVEQSGLGRDRELFLTAQLTALECIARGLAGERIGFVEEIRARYDVEIAPGDSDRYRAAHRRLDDLLPGTGPLAHRLAAFRRAEAVPVERLGAAVEVLVAALRARTGAVLDLPAGERVSVDLVDDRPWSGLTRYLGDLHSRVTINAGAGLRASQLVALVAHEAYPGHHTEQCLLHAPALPGNRYRPPEQRIVVVGTPQSLVGEGAADMGLHVVVGPGWGSWGAEVLAEAGVRSDGALAEAVEEAMLGLAGVRQDAALLLHQRGASVDDAVTHLRRWLLITEPRARRLVGFLTHPLWRTYTTTYVEGAALVRSWLERPGADALTNFRRLLHEPLVPATLRAEVASGSDPAGPGGAACVGPCGGRPDVSGA